MLFYRQSFLFNQGLLPKINFTNCDMDEKMQKNFVFKLGTFYQENNFHDRFYHQNGNDRHESFIITLWFKMLLKIYWQLLL